MMVIFQISDLPCAMWNVRQDSRQSADGDSVACIKDFVEIQEAGSNHLYIDIGAFAPIAQVLHAISQSTYLFQQTAQNMYGH